MDFYLLTITRGAGGRSYYRIAYLSLSVNDICNFLCKHFNNSDSQEEFWIYGIDIEIRFFHNIEQIGFYDVVPHITASGCSLNRRIKLDTRSRVRVLQVEDLEPFDLSYYWEPELPTVHKKWYKEFRESRSHSSEEIWKRMITRVNIIQIKHDLSKLWPQCGFLNILDCIFPPDLHCLVIEYFIPIHANWELCLLPEPWSGRWNNERLILHYGVNLEVDEGKWTRPKRKRKILV